MAYRLLFIVNTLMRENQPKNTNGNLVNKTPFMELLSTAEGVKITEIPSTKDRKFLVAIEANSSITNELANNLNHSREHLLSSAQILLTNGDFLLARNIYSYLLKDNVRDVSALRGLGLAFYRLGDKSSARRCFKAVWELFGLEEALVWMGLCLLTEKQDVAALGLFQKVKQPNLLPKPLQFDFYKEMGNCSMRLENYAFADECYQKALVLEPASDSVYVNLGMMAVQQGHLQTAEIHFQKALKLNDKNGKAHCGLGIVCAEFKDLAKARQCFVRALDIDSQNSIALFQLSEMDEHPSTAALVKERAAAFLAKEPKNREVRFLLATQYFREGNWRASEAEVKHILTLYPDYVSARSLLDEINATTNPR